MLGEGVDRPVHVLGRGAVVEGDGDDALARVHPAHEIPEELERAGLRERMDGRARHDERQR